MNGPGIPDDLRLAGEVRASTHRVGTGAIDVHSHYLPFALLEALERRQTAPRVTTEGGAKFVEYGAGLATPLRPVFTDAAETIHEMDQAGIQQSLLSVTIPGVDWLEPDEAVAVAEASNQETAELSARYPGRIFGLATVPLQVPELAAEVLRNAVKRGLRGALIYSNVAGEHLDHPSRRSFFSAAALLDVPVLLHPTYPLCAPTLSVHGMVEMTGFLFDTTTAALRLVFDGLYDRHPDFKFIVPHAGSFIPYFTGRIGHFDASKPGSTGQISGQAEAHIRKLYVDTVCDWPPALKLCMDFLGSDHIVFGSDHPFWSMATALKTVGDLDAAADVRDAILFGNARRIFRIEAPESTVSRP